MVEYWPCGCHTAFTTYIATVTHQLTVGSGFPVTLTSKMPLSPSVISWSSGFFKRSGFSVLSINIAVTNDVIGLLTTWLMRCLVRPVFSLLMQTTVWNWKLLWRACHHWYTSMCYTTVYCISTEENPSYKWLELHVGSGLRGGKDRVGLLINVIKVKSGFITVLKWIAHTSLWPCQPQWTIEMSKKKMDTVF